MTYEQLTELEDEAFKRYCGVRREIFNEMREVQQAAERAKRKSGRPSLSLEDQLLLTLQYWREYRTLFHVASDFGFIPTKVRNPPQDFSEPVDMAS